MELRRCGTQGDTSPPRSSRRPNPGGSRLSRQMQQEPSISSVVGADRSIPRRRVKQSQGLSTLPLPARHSGHTLEPLVPFEVRFQVGFSSGIASGLKVGLHVGLYLFCTSRKGGDTQTLPEGQPQSSVQGCSCQLPRRRRNSSPRRASAIRDECTRACVLVS